MQANHQEMPTVFILSGPIAIGKTTIAYQLADQIEQRGYVVRPEEQQARVDIVDENDFQAVFHMARTPQRLMVIIADEFPDASRQHIKLLASTIAWDARHAFLQSLVAKTENSLRRGRHVVIAANLRPDDIGKFGLVDMFKYYIGHNIGQAVRFVPVTLICSRKEQNDIAIAQHWLGVRRDEVLNDEVKDWRGAPFTGSASVSVHKRDRRGYPCQQFLDAGILAHEVIKVATDRPTLFSTKPVEGSRALYTWDNLDRAMYLGNGRDSLPVLLRPGIENNPYRPTNIPLLDLFAAYKRDQGRATFLKTLVGFIPS